MLIFAVIKAVIMKIKKEVIVIGLGDMGKVLASTLLRQGYQVTVWNRTPAKAASLIQEGAVFIPEIAAAIATSPVIITCVTNYNNTRSILGREDVAPVIAGKVLIELSSGTPQNARDGAAWARERSLDYIDGVILATPSQIGRPDTTFEGNQVIGSCKLFVFGSANIVDKGQCVLSYIKNKHIGVVSFFYRLLFV
jgi:hypothetical protein